MLLDEKRLRLAFNRIDVTNTGYINKQDLAHVLGATEDQVMGWLSSYLWC